MDKVNEKVEKKHGFRSFVFFSLALIIFTLVWARFISTSGLVVKEYSIINESIPENYNGIKIIHFSDLHFGRTVNNKEISKLVEKINSYKPDIIVFTGDLIDKDINVSENTINEIKTILSKLDATIGKFAVKGNHDYVEDYFDNIMIGSGFEILNNQSKLLYYKDETPIEIIGLPSAIKEKYSLDNTFNENDYYRILLAHEPDIIDELQDYNIDLMLSGHSHNGQVRIPIIGAVVTPKFAKKYYEEYYKVEETDLYVSSGIGTTQLSFRFLNKPSINLYRLYIE